MHSQHKLENDTTRKEVFLHKSFPVLWDGRIAICYIDECILVLKHESDT